VQPTHRFYRIAFNCGVPSWTKPKHMTFANVERQLKHIIDDVSAFTGHFERWVDWWASMKTGLDGLKCALPHIKLPVATIWTLSEVTRGWNEVADQFSLYLFKVRRHVTNQHRNISLTSSGADNTICEGLFPLPPCGRGYRTSLLWWRPVYDPSGQSKCLMI
jgi:hypothetical protein